MKRFFSVSKFKDKNRNSRPVISVNLISKKEKKNVEELWQYN